MPRLQLLWQSPAPSLPQALAEPLNPPPQLLDLGLGLLKFQILAFQLLRAPPGYM